MSFKNFISTLLFLSSFFFPYGNSLFFNISRFDEGSTSLIEQQGDAIIDAGRIKLTKGYAIEQNLSSEGRALYKELVILWDEKSEELADFTTHFSFSINCVNVYYCGDGFTFFLAKHTATIPKGSEGSRLALYAPETDFRESENGVVAVEFDTYKNTWDPSADHVGIDVNSIISVANVSLNSSLKDGRTANAWVTYNSSTHNLSVFLTYDKNPIYRGMPILSYNIDLRDHLPSQVAIGFSASTNWAAELHEIISWSFSSNLEGKTEEQEKPKTPEKSKIPEKAENPEKTVRSKVGLIVGLAALFGTILILLLGVWFVYSCKKPKKQEDSDIEREFEKEKGPQRYTFNELVAATNNFAVERRLGKGGFGEVYKGVLNNEEVAIKRVSSGSKQGKKEYMSEVKIISRLRHRNIVQLVGWCHKEGEFLLVYKYMTNGSLDYHLYDKENILPWPVRYSISLGLASALLYLHEEWEQCIIHRDIKPSNVMLDSEFEAKLGDFGLARLVDHEIGSETTILAGTMGYWAPESVSTGRTRKESDVYSFGIVALEIACARKPLAVDGVTLVERVWEFYGRGMILEAMDPRLGTNFDQDEIERLMVVGLWCAHPNHIVRPSIRQAIAALKLEAPLPTLPPTMPMPIYSAFSANSLSATQSSGSSATSSQKTYITNV